MPRSLQFRVTGIEEYLKKIGKVEGDLEKVVAEAIHESAKPIYDDIRAWAEKHRQTGAVLAGVDLSEPVVDGNLIYVTVGINSGKSPNAWHAVFVEFGSPTNVADPGIRRAFENNKAKVKRIQRQILKKAMPVD